MWGSRVRAAAGLHVLAEREFRGHPHGIQFNLQLGGTFGRRAETGRDLHGGDERTKARKNLHRRTTHEPRRPGLRRA